MAAILMAAVLSLVGKVVIASRTVGSNDALFWEADLRQLQDAGPLALYENGVVLRSNGTPYHHEVFNQPPFTIRLLYLGGWISSHTRMPFRFWLRAACAVADLASVMLLLGLLRGARWPVSPLALFLVAASPISLMISGFHGNTDPIMMALLLLAVYLAHSGAAGRAGSALGLAAGIKIVPLLFVPALALYLAGRKRAVFLATAIGVFVIGSLPILIDHPGLVWLRVFTYSPQPPGIWGVSRFITAFGTEAEAQAYTYLGKAVVLLVLGIVSFSFHLRRPQPPIVLQCGLLAFILLSLAPGFGVQYLAWLAPWTCLLSGRQAVAFHSVAGLLLAWFYTRAAHGFPWVLADSTTRPVWYGATIFAGVLCWLVICWLTYSLWQRARDLPNSPSP